jgi:Domain of unknown function (DUF4062)
MAHKAFVSSTFEDLQDHRRQVIKVLRKAGITVDPMEEWTAASGEPKRVSQDRIRDCDLCILLVAFRRGYIPGGETLSITQLEYQAAVASGIDVLAFILKEDSPWPRKFDEMDKDPLIRRWRDELARDRVVSYFDFPADSIDVATAVTRWIADAARKPADPGDSILGTWEHYTSVADAQFTFNSRFVVAKIGKRYVMSILDQADDAEIEPSIGLFDVHSDGQVWTFKSNWRHNQIGTFKLFRITDDKFEGYAMYNGERYQSDRFVRVGRPEDLT